MQDIYQVIIRPIITDKSTVQREVSNKVTFEVHPKANKKEIKNAIEKIFKVSVLNVHTIPQKGKVKRVGRYRGRKKDWKKELKKERKRGKGFFVRVF
jgi:large subunit ribosomal protein L23